ncbi:MAG: flagellar basal body rod protein FlgF [Zoogloeaceae bacterium]|jgi:flagellar basal-body rod protein FlgF|nr:flagellar basal body rod protein FlgF [Zoogloeaceae bacterium]
MDRLIYTAMTGAKHTFLQQAGVGNNLANVNTVGFKAQMHRFLAVPVQTQNAYDSRAFTVDASVETDYDEGPLMATDNPLDVAINGQGWLAVQTPDGGEAYTRAGTLMVNADGDLITKSGLPVMGDGGGINVPPDNTIAIGPDGTVSVVPRYGSPNVVNIIGRIKLVNPPQADMERGADGLFHMKAGAQGGAIAPLDDTVRVTSGYLEGSNVNPAEAMVSLISLSRQFELQMQMIQEAQQNAQRADQLLSLSA